MSKAERKELTVIALYLLVASLVGGWTYSEKSSFCDTRLYCRVDAVENAFKGAFWPIYLPARLAMWVAS